MSATPMVLALALLVGTALPSQAQDSSDDAFSKIPWQTGPILGDLGKQAQVAVPDNCVFTGEEGTREFMELTENPVNGDEVGTVLCKLLDASGKTESTWFAVFEFDESGFVKDDEKESLDADAILASLKQGNEHGNRERKQRGWDAIYLDGWQRAPHYDERTRNLTWATRLHAEDDAKVLNHSVRLLGRGGVMSVDLVVSPEYYDRALPAFNAVVGNYHYKAGHTYAEWRQGDKIASYGLTALVAGGAGAVLMKTGLLQKFGKAIVLALAGAAAAVKKFFFGKGKDASAKA
jgi:uncharacterized membrane-anchored protein